MSAKKRKPLGSAIEEVVFGTKEALPVPTATELASLAPTPTASLTPESALPASISLFDNATTVRFIAHRKTTAAGSIRTRTSFHSIKGA